MLFGRVGLASRRTGPSGKVGDDIALPSAVFFICHRPSLDKIRVQFQRVKLGISHAGQLIQGAVS